MAGLPPRFKILSFPNNFFSILIVFVALLSSSLACWNSESSLSSSPMRSHAFNFHHCKSFFLKFSFKQLGEVAGTRQLQSPLLLRDDDKLNGHGVEKEISGGRRLLFGGPGSSPPRCSYKCGRCSPCKPVHVPVPPGTPVTTEYYPEAWMCKCGNRLYMP